MSGDRYEIRIVDEERRVFVRCVALRSSHVGDQHGDRVAVVRRDAHRRARLARSRSRATALRLAKNKEGVMIDLASLPMGSLFAGVGGLELGLEWAGVGRTIWQVEIDPWCRGVLAMHWPKVKRHHDVRKVGRDTLEPAAIICGGFPCQDLSVAGKGKGLEGDRSGQWFQMLRIIEETRPLVVVIDASGSSSSPCVEQWSTPMASDAIRGASTSRDLPSQLAQWPTAVTTDARSSARGTTTTGVMHTGKSLTDAIREWPTPTAAEYGTSNNGCPHDGREAYATAGKPSLSTTARASGGTLNPSWVEALMGFPIGWTDGPLDPETLSLFGNHRDR